MNGCNKCDHGYCEGCKAHHEQKNPISPRELDAAWHEHQRLMASESCDSIRAEAMADYAESLTQEKLPFEQKDFAQKPAKQTARAKRRKDSYFGKQKHSDHKKNAKQVDLNEKQKLLRYKEAKAAN